MEPALTSMGCTDESLINRSDDGGRTWSNERWATLGRQGRYRTQLRWGRLGAARNRVFRLSMSDPVRTALIAADIEAEVGT